MQNNILNPTGGKKALSTLTLTLTLSTLKEGADLRLSIRLRWKRENPMRLRGIKSVAPAPRKRWWRCPLAFVAIAPGMRVVSYAPVGQSALISRKE